jgi:hypothetical protein
MGGACARRQGLVVHRANWDKVEAKEKRTIPGKVSDRSNG